jgi:TRAP-type C4-dicarboxylate transport system substrate-binding protein
MKRRFTAIALATATVAALIGCSASPGEEGEEGEVHTLKFAYHLGEQNYLAQATKWWAEQVEERSDGRIVVEAYYNESLCPFVDILTCLNDGRADLTSVATLNHPTELPSASIVGIPFLTTNQGAAALALRALYEENDSFNAEWEAAGVKPLAFGPGSNAYMGADFPIEGIDDLAGHSTRGTGYLQHAVTAIGMSPVQMAFGELYDALDRGAIDTWVTSLDGAAGISLAEVTGHFIDPRTGMFSGQANPTISAAVYDGLPEDLQQIIDEVSAELGEIYIEEFFLPGVLKDCETVMADVESFTELSDSDVEEWRDLASDLVESKWTEDVAAAGVQDPEALLDDFKRLLKEKEGVIEEVPVVETCNSFK